MDYSVQDLKDYAIHMAQQYGIDPKLFSALIESESSWNPSAVSSTGCTGLAQFCKATAKEYGVTDRQNPWQSLDGAARYLRDLLGRHDGDPAQAIAAYKGVSVGGATWGNVQSVLSAAGQAGMGVMGTGGATAASGASPLANFVGHSSAVLFGWFLVAALGWYSVRNLMA